MLQITSLRREFETIEFSSTSFELRNSWLAGLINPQKQIAGCDETLRLPLLHSIVDVHFEFPYDHFLEWE